MNTEKKYTPHPLADVIKAWADGKTIEFRENPSCKWKETSTPRWFPEIQYRVKPEEVVGYTAVTAKGQVGAIYAGDIATLSTNGYYQGRELQGYCKRTTIDGKVVALEFIPR